MIVRIPLQFGLARIGAFAISFLLFGTLIGAAARYLILGTLTDERLTLPREMLQTGLSYVPNSPRLHARMASAEIAAPEHDYEKAETHIRQAIALLPGEYSYRLILASVLESQGNRPAAEQSYRDALELAPQYLEAHWRLANNLVRQGKVSESLPYFKYAASRNLSLLPNAFDLIWQVSNQDLSAIQQITDSAPKAHLMQADFLIKQGKYTEAATVFRPIERQIKQNESETASIINGLLTANQHALARELWGQVMSPDANQPQPLLWNGSFETPAHPLLNHFDWQIKDSVFARVVIDPQNGFQDSTALRITFLGKDTARLDDQIKQLFLVKPGKKYRLECQYKTRDLITPMGPRLAVTDLTGKNVIGASEALSEGSRNWELLGFDFIAPANTAAVLLQIQRIPKYEYDDPSRGTVWFDEFTLREQ